MNFPLERKQQQHQKKDNRNNKRGSLQEARGEGEAGKKNIYDEKKQCQNENKIKR